MTFRAHCPVPTCSDKVFLGETQEAAVELVREHLKRNLEDPLHSDIAESEGWFDTDPLGG